MERRIRVEIHPSERQTLEHATEFQLRIEGLRSHRGLLVLTRHIPHPIQDMTRLYQKLQRDALQDFRDLVSLLEMGKSENL